MSAQAVPPPVVPPGAVSADFLLFLERWYALTSKGGPYYQRQQEPKR